VPEADNRGFEGGEAASGREVLMWIRCERVGWQLQACAPGRDAKPIDDIAEEEDSILLAPEGQVSGSVAGNLEHREAGHMVALLERVAHRMARARDQAVLDTHGQRSILQAEAGP
jgi:hypothetical protein